MSRGSRTGWTALAVVVLGASVTLPAGAVNERWYMMHNCVPADHAHTSWVMNPYGFINLHSSYELHLACAQPHLLGNDGYDQSRAVVFDRNWSSDVTGNLCRSYGQAGPAVCDTEKTVVALSTPITLYFDPIVDSLSYYYWTFDVPNHDPSGPSGGYSGVVSMYFDDN